MTDRERMQEMHDENKEGINGLTNGLNLLIQRMGQFDVRFDKIDSKLDEHSSFETEITVQGGKIDTLEKKQNETESRIWYIVIALLGFVLEQLYKYLGDKH